jgi:hypothetical protein
MEELPHDLKMIIYAYAHEKPFLHEITEDNYEDYTQWTYKKVRDVFLEDGETITEEEYEHELASGRVTCFFCEGISRLVYPRRTRDDDLICYSCTIYELKSYGEYDKYTHPRVKEFINEMYELGKNNYYLL